jgi:hypothetical protein
MDLMTTVGRVEDDEQDAGDVQDGTQDGPWPVTDLAALGRRSAKINFFKITVRFS